MADLAVYTVGCKVNQAESEELKMGLIEAGHGVCRDPAAADLCVVNTCTVTAESDRKCRKLIRWLGRKGAKAIVVAGCYAEVNPGDLKDLPGVVKLLPNTHKDEWLQEISSMLPATKTLPVPPVRFRSRGFIKVQDGCERECSYCIVPRARGKERSRPPMEVVSEVRRWLEKEVGELVLSGINLGRYNRGGGYDLASLVRDVLSSGSRFRVRLSSIELEDLKKEWIDEWSVSNRICPHLHLPLQSGDEAILRDMGRGYRPEDFLEAVREIRSSWPRAALTTEVIVGYPGESEEAFQRTVDLLQEVRPARIHVFRFSPRAGTRAGEKKVTACPQETENRSALLREMAEGWRMRYIEERMGETREFLVERLVERNVGRAALGTTEDYIKGILHEPTVAAEPGRILEVSISGLEGGMASLENKALGFEPSRIDVDV